MPIFKNHFLFFLYRITMLLKEPENLRIICVCACLLCVGECLTTRNKFSLIFALTLILIFRVFFSRLLYFYKNIRTNRLCHFNVISLLVFNYSMSFINQLDSNLQNSENSETISKVHIDLIINLTFPLNIPSFFYYFYMSCENKKRK